MPWNNSTRIKILYLFVELTALSSKKKKTTLFSSKELERIGQSSFFSQVRNTACKLQGRYTWSGVWTLWIRTNTYLYNLGDSAKDFLAIIFSVQSTQRYTWPFVRKFCDVGIWIKTTNCSPLLTNNSNPSSSLYSW